jgi:hypothetical protein
MHNTRKERRNIAGIFGQEGETFTEDFFAAGAAFGDFDFGGISWRLFAERQQKTELRRSAASKACQQLVKHVNRQQEGQKNEEAGRASKIGASMPHLSRTTMHVFMHACIHTCTHIHKYVCLNV